MKQIKIDQVTGIGIAEYEGMKFIVLKLANGSEYLANGPIEKVESVYYCHEGYGMYTSPKSWL